MEVSVLKEWLSRARNIQEKLNNLLTAYDADIESGITDQREAEAEIINEINKSLLVKAEIFSAISKVEDSKKRTILYNYYISSINGNNKTEEQIAIELGYSESQIIRIMKEALKELSERIK